MTLQSSIAKLTASKFRLTTRTRLVSRESSSEAVMPSADYSKSICTSRFCITTHLTLWQRSKHPSPWQLAMSSHTSFHPSLILMAMTFLRSTSPWWTHKKTSAHHSWCLRMLLTLSLSSQTLSGCRVEPTITQPSSKSPTLTAWWTSTTIQWQSLVNLFTSTTQSSVTHIAATQLWDATTPMRLLATSHASTQSQS